MHDDLGGLTDREKETLRLLGSGYDAKSVATHLGLSVHTVNERLRMARRKLGVSSSRAAARWLIQSEQNPPKIFGPKYFGDAVAAGDVNKARLSPAHRSRSWAFGIGGILMFALVAAAMTISLTSIGSPASISQQSSPQATQEIGAEVVDGSLAWLSLIDQGDWDESWDAAGSAFRTQVTKAGWEAAVSAAREPLGSVVTRVQMSADRTTTLPGAPAGDYWLVQYQTTFENNPRAIETVVLVNDGNNWRVTGYFVR